jgi:hypothetical protein
MLAQGQVDHYSIDTSNLGILGFDEFINTEKMVVDIVQQVWRQKSNILRRAATSKILHFGIEDIQHPLVDLCKEPCSTQSPISASDLDSQPVVLLFSFHIQSFILKVRYYN